MKTISKRIKNDNKNEFQTIFEAKQNNPNLIDLSVGLPEENTNSSIKQAGIDAINNNYTRYSSANGLLKLREAIAKKLQKENNIAATADTVSVVPGLTTGQMALYLTIIDPGDEIIIIEPSYPPYSFLAQMIGAKVTSIKCLYDYQPDINALNHAVSENTKAIVINSPNNPTGAVYGEDCLKKIADIASIFDTLIISDEIYEKYVFEGKHFSIGSIYENTVTMNGFSKSHAMTGWRLGYINGPLELIKTLNNVLQYSVFASSTISQYAGIEALKVEPDLSNYRLKRDFAISELHSIGFDVAGGDGAYYLYIRCPNNFNSGDFFQLALKNNLLIVPGSAFSGESTHFRISYGTSMDELRKGLRVLQAIVD
ncbi:aminotransferase class I/II-fold pyridoxal phosphate-dependent enzyme [Candidatus Saccharibacteria bacterium]|jgi:aspartate aminotransferase|nr:aminotransferase class I/II-fold pyridoxal phosphate-dependent enzyme [Candidatus Saccharibacteria bacterium]